MMGLLILDGVPVVLHSDHCAKKLLPWFDQMLEADAAYFAKFGEPLFSSHMLDLSEEPDEENISICKTYFEKMAPMKLFLEMEIGITGQGRSIFVCLKVCTDS
jgi:fructose-bisphosphate aldolase class II